MFSGKILAAKLKLLKTQAIKKYAMKKWCDEKIYSLGREEGLGGGVELLFFVHAWLRADAGKN